MEKRKLPIAMLLTKIRSLTSSYEKAILLTLSKIGALAQFHAVKNSKNNFIGRGQRTLTGRLMNSIFWKVGKHNGMDSAFVGTRGIPYGKIHELGGKIEPKKSKYLWVRSPYAAKKGSRFKNFTPKDFYMATKSDPSHYFFGGSFGSTGTAMYKRGKTYQALFFLKKSVWIPSRPYLRPAAKIASDKIPEYLNEMFKE